MIEIEDDMTSIYSYYDTDDDTDDDTPIPPMQPANHHQIRQWQPQENSYIHVPYALKT